MKEIITFLTWLIILESAMFLIPIILYLWVKNDVKKSRNEKKE
jgi:hypothetical protein